jgi:hypothetical protein
VSDDPCRSAGAPAFCCVVLAEEDGSTKTECKDVNGKYANEIYIRFDDTIQDKPTADIMALDHYAHARHARLEPYNQAITKCRIHRIAHHFATIGERSRTRPMTGPDDPEMPQYRAMGSVHSFLTDRAALLTTQATTLALTAPVRLWM